MSTQQQLDEQLARPALELIERALAEVRRMCQPGTHWNMRVPVDVEDSDVVISGALIAAKKELLARGVVPSAPSPTDAAAEAMRKAGTAIVNHIGNLSGERPDAEHLPTAFAWLGELDKLSDSLAAAVIAFNSAQSGRGVDSGGVAPAGEPTP